MEYLNGKEERKGKGKNRPYYDSIDCKITWLNIPRITSIFIKSFKKQTAEIKHSWIWELW